jgi:DNA-binding MarR family transcriptional regulator
VLQLARRLRAERPNPSVTLSALGLLARLHQLGPMPAAALARAERLQPQSLSRLIAKLDADGLIARQPDPIDRRALVIAITSAGRRALKRDMDARRDWLEAALAMLTAAERERLTAAAELMLRLAAAGKSVKE